jgi:heterodisulfide reductase subunit D
MAEETKKTKPLISGFMKSTQLMELDGCTRCQECMKWCPAYAVRPERPEVGPMHKAAKWRELLSSQKGLRAKILGGKPLTEGELSKFTEDMYICTTCGVCGTVCEAGINTVDLWEAVRPNLVARGSGPYGKQSAFPKLLSEYRNPFMAKQEERLSWLPKDAKVDESGEIAYFAGCTAAYRQQALAVASVRILNALETDFCMLGKDEWCCASALVRTGQREVMRDHAVHNIDALKDRGVKTVLYACAGCLRTATIDWPRWYEGYIPYKNMPLSVYLRDKINKGQVNWKRPINYRVTFHDPCHAGRHLMHVSGKDWAFEAPRDVLKSIPGIDFVEMARNRALQRCCGAGGGVKAGIPELAIDLGKERVKDAEMVAADIISSTCPFCRRNIMDARTAAGSPAKVVDVVELMAKAMDLDTTVPENPYSKFQEQDVIICEENVCKPGTMKQKDGELVIEESK